MTPDGATLVAAGNFTIVDGQSRWQVALVDVGSRPARLLDWQTDRFNDTDPQGELRCSPAFDSHPRDVDVSPDGTYFVVVTTGGYTSRGALCDTASRWEIVGPGHRAFSRRGSTTAAATASRPWPSPARRSTSVATPAG